MEAAKPYAEQMTAVLTELASNSALDHPLLVERHPAERAAVLVVTSDRGQAGGYNANVLREAEQLQSMLREQGKEPVLYVIGRKGVNYYRFRKREVAASWTGFSEQPRYEDAAEAARVLVAAFMAGAGERDTEEAADTAGAPAEAVESVDELHLVYTQFKNMVTQIPQARRMAPMEVEYAEEDSSAVRRTGRDQAALHVRAGRGDAVRRVAAEVHQRPAVRGVAGVGGLGVGEPAAGHEGRNRQCERIDPYPDPGVQPGSSGPDHPGDQ